MAAGRRVNKIGVRQIIRAERVVGQRQIVVTDLAGQVRLDAVVQAGGRLRFHIFKLVARGFFFHCRRNAAVRNALAAGFAGIADGRIAALGAGGRRRSADKDQLALRAVAF